MRRADGAKRAFYPRRSVANRVPTETTLLFPGKHRLYYKERNERRRRATNCARSNACVTLGVLTYFTVASENFAMNALHPQYVVDENQTPKAVLLPVGEWEQVVEELEELDDIRAFDLAKAGSQETIPFEQAVREIEEGSGE